MRGVDATFVSPLFFSVDSIRCSTARLVPFFILCEGKQTPREARGSEKLSLV